MTIREQIQLSDSQLKNWQRCQRRWGYERLLKLDPQEDKWNLTHGSAVHKGLEHIHQGDTLQGATAAAHADMAGGPQADQYMSDLVAAQLYGYTTHFLPQYNQQWDTIAIEEWFDYEIDPLVRMRGLRDNVSAAKGDPNFIAMLDFKTTGAADGGDLGKQIETNVQLSRYSISYATHQMKWPSMTGLIFLFKGRSKSEQTNIDNCRKNPSHYFMKSKPFTPAMAEFAIAVQDADRTYGKQMYVAQSMFDQQGVAALEFLPPNLNGCVAYGRLCGFAQGCHSNRPAHRLMMGQSV